MKPDLILHIGTTKTGSTSLQKYLYSNRHYLKRENILFPESGFLIRDDERVPTSGHSNLFYKSDALELLAKEIKNNPGKTVLISTELISLIISGGASKYTSKLKQILKIFSKIRVVVYLRRQDLWVESQYIDIVTNIWSSFSGGVEDFIKEQKTLELDYKKFIENIENDIGCSEVIVRLHGKKELPNGIIPDFMDVLSISGYSNWSQELKSYHNTHYGDDVFQLALLLNKLPLSGIHYTNLMKGWLPDRTDKSVSMVYLNSNTRHFLEDKFKKSNNYVAKVYLQKSNGSLFSRIEPDLNSVEMTRASYLYSYNVVERVIKSISSVTRDTIADKEAEYSKAMRDSIADKEAEYTTLGKQFAKELDMRAKIEKQLSEKEKELVDVRTSTTFMLGKHIKESIASPRNLVKLPYTVWLIYRKARNRGKKTGECQ